MARSLSWIPRLAEIRRSVDNSVRSHYGRRDLEILFGLQPRAAGKLLALFSKTAIGPSHLVAREALAEYLEQIREADDVAEVGVRLRQRKEKVSRVKLRNLTRDEVQPIDVSEIAMPLSVRVSRGRLTVEFKDGEELIEAMLWLCRVVESEGFEREYLPAPLKMILPEDWAWEQECRENKQVNAAYAEYLRRRRYLRMLGSPEAERPFVYPTA